MSVYHVDEPVRRLSVRVPARLDISKEDVGYVFPHVTAYFMDIMKLLQQGGTASSPERSATYELDSPEVSDEIEHFLRSYIRKIITSGCLSQNMKQTVTPPPGSIIPFLGRIKVVPTVLFPAPFPLVPFRAAVKYMPSMVRLIDNISCHPQWLLSVVAHISDVDNFTSKLIDIATEVYVSGKRHIREDLRAHVLRADYMLNLSMPPQNSNSSASKADKEFCRVCHYDFCLCKLQNVVGGDTGPESSLSEAFRPFQGVSLKLVEVNTVSCAMSILSGMVSDVHSDFVEETLRSRIASDNVDSVTLPLSFKKLHPSNSPVGGIVDTLAKAHEQYVKRYCSTTDASPPCVMQVVTEGIANFFDVHGVAVKLFNSHGIIVKVVTMKELCQWKREGRLFLRPTTEPPKRLLDSSIKEAEKHGNEAGRLYFATAPLSLDTNKDLLIREVSVIYYRTCYTEENMECDKDSWSVRLLLEYADAVKVPSVLGQLAGCKRIQSILSEPLGENPFQSEDSIDYEQSPCGVTVLSQAETLSVFKSINVQQVDPSLPNNLPIVQDAINNPGNYVLKSQAEGGAELLLYEELSEKLREGIKGDPHTLSKYVLMQRINPPLQKAVFVRGEEGYFNVSVEGSITELGIYGCAVISGQSVISEDCSGYLARTKNKNAAGGGVCAGYASVGSILLF
ncbi:glutathione synthetase ATP-binding domain containing protein [Babesia gibsoni]|uniref:glutathione synthase n=1 Tax=Babesia gibsoni TaxID=33632 RepID=A0AAD8LGD2_BABGI|nr:glutathione synthetase ATP-binding domain containing protein [Babesia gibsoni]